MTEILCRWLNEDIKVSPKLSEADFGRQFCNGYLFGEVLSKHGLQADFPLFSRGTSSEAKLKNFMRLEPTFRLLDIPFQTNLARDVMTSRPGAAVKLLYHLFVALNRNKKRELTGRSLEFARSTGKEKLEKVESGLFQERLKHQIPRQVDLNFEELVKKFQERQRQHEDIVLKERKSEEERLHREQWDHCQKALQETRLARERQAQMYAKLKPLSPSKTGQPAQDGGKMTDKSLSRKKLAKQTALAEDTRVSIDAFESHLHLPATPSSEDDGVGQNGFLDHVTTTTSPPAGTTHVMDRSSAGYVDEIKRRVQDREAGQQEREKRRRRVLVQQMEALQEQEEERRKQQLVERLMRQCQQESRIATQLMHIRRQKDTIRKNRIFQLKQFEKQRTKEFQEALDREAELCKQSAREREARVAHHLTLYHSNQRLQAERNAGKHYQLCRSVVEQVLELASKIAEYRQLTENDSDIFRCCDIAH